MFNYQSFVDAVESYNSGTWTADQTVSWVQTAYDYVGQEADQIQQLLAETGYADESPVEVQTGLEGIESYQDALERLWDFLENGQLEDLDLALEAARHGQGCLKKAWQMNLDASEELAYTTLG